jgi:hypothetical protein
VAKELDVFLSHNSKDKRKVRALARALEHQFGLLTWPDEDQIAPGKNLREELEAGIARSRSVAVLVGRDGLGPWETVEMDSALQLAVERKIRVIPVLLPGAPSKPALPPFLRRLRWVDLRPGLRRDLMDELIWGITDRSPDGPARRGRSHCRAEPSAGSVVDKPADPGVSKSKRCSRRAVRIGPRFRRRAGRGPHCDQATGQASGTLVSSRRGGARRPRGGL